MLNKQFANSIWGRSIDQNFVLGKRCLNYVMILIIDFWFKQYKPLIQKYIIILNYMRQS
jgi:hypothetical protein